MPIISICDGCGKKLGVLTRNTMNGKKLRSGIFCDVCFESVEDFAIKKYKIQIEAKNEIGKY